MIFNTIRMLASWCADGTEGVNARIPAVELDGTDAAPPNLAAVLDPTVDGNDDVARLQLAKERVLPVLLVMQYQEALFEDAIATELFRSEEVPIAFVYATRKGATATAAREGFYTMRALTRCLNALMDADGSPGGPRERNGILIEVQNRLTAPRLIAPVEGSAVSLALFASYQVAETNP